mmetsp:Transcript_33195/g.91815  ORF Transcript_33195/g.91815 Transcript_33195/m.91815 type:complete len:365 (-) Transcript_33195:1208-2302(-)
MLGAIRTEIPRMCSVSIGSPHELRATSGPSRDALAMVLCQPGARVDLLRGYNDLAPVALRLVGAPAAIVPGLHRAPVPGLVRPSPLLVPRGQPGALQLGVASARSLLLRRDCGLHGGVHGGRCRRLWWPRGVALDLLPPGVEVLVAAGAEAEWEDHAKNDARPRKGGDPQPAQPDRAQKVEDDADQEDDEAPTLLLAPALLDLCQGRHVHGLGQRIFERLASDEAEADGERPQHVAGREAAQMRRLGVGAVLTAVAPVSAGQLVNARNFRLGESTIEDCEICNPSFVVSRQCRIPAHNHLCITTNLCVGPSIRRSLHMQSAIHVGSVNISVIGERQVIPSLLKVGKHWVDSFLLAPLIQAERLP